jgi:membrane-associated protease RseP (regulator of RpoE activity)
MVSLLEGIRRKPFRKEVYLRFSTIGIALVLLLFFIGLTNDLGGRTG